MSLCFDIYSLLVFSVLLYFHISGGAYPNKMRLFFTLNEAVTFLKNESNPLADRILQCFENDCHAMGDPTLPKLRKPFVVIEGNHKHSRKVVGMRLAKMMQGRYLAHPAHCLLQFSADLPKGTSFLFRRAFHLLSLHALAYDTQVHLSLNRAVVVDGYWWDELTTAAVQTYKLNRMPPLSHPLFCFPAELLRPDLVFFINFPDDLHGTPVSTRSPKSWKPRMLNLYQQLQAQGHPIVVQDLTGVFSSVTDSIYEILVKNLSVHRDVWFDPHHGVNFDYHDQ